VRVLLVAVAFQDALQLDSKAGEGDSGELGSDMDDLDDYLTQLDAGANTHTLVCSCDSGCNLGCISSLNTQTSFLVLSQLVSTHSKQ
jgi:hypothetical protein